MENPLRIKLRLALLTLSLAGLATMHLVARRWRQEPVEVVEESPSPESPPPEPVVDVAPAAPRDHERRLRFRDGTIAHLASPHTELNVTSVQERRIVSELSAGGARFEITRRPARIFRVTAGTVSVESTTATVDLQRQGARLSVRVLDGRVRVAWATGRTQLGKRQLGVFPPERASEPAWARPK